MQKKSSELVQSSTRTAERIRSNTKHFLPILRGGWVIKFSIYEFDNILITVISSYTEQVIIRYFTKERDAVDFINRLVVENPEKYLSI
jgi:hypothetical protein